MGTTTARSPRADAIWTVKLGATTPTAGTKASGATKNQETAKPAEGFGAPAGCSRGPERKFILISRESRVCLFFQALDQKLIKSLCFVISRLFIVSPEY